MTCGCGSHSVYLLLTLTIRFIYVIPLFVWILTSLIVFGLRFIQPVVSLLTFVKGALILVTVSLSRE